MEAVAANTIPKMVIDDQVAKYTFEMTSEAVRIPCVLFSAAFYLTRTTRWHYTASSNLNMNMSWKGQTGNFWNNMKNPGSFHRRTRTWNC